MINRYRRSRETAGLSLAQASKRTGIDADALRVIEDGTVPPWDDQLRDMASAYGCSVRWLRGETAELSAENAALLWTVDHTGDRETLREFMLMISTRDPGAEERKPNTLADIAAVGSTSSAAISRTVASKRRYVRSQGQTRNHHCHWPGCEAQVPPAMWGCRAHWFKLPKRLRDRIWATYAPGQEVDMSPSREYLDVADDVQRWIAEHGQSLKERAK